MAPDYTDSLNLPSTDFAMRANLPQREPEMLRQNEEKDIYHKLLKKNADKPRFILHDGPPFSNGNIHMGTAMNKILKDFIVKYKFMTGYLAPYIPGWDNHGMPIESAIIKQNKLDRKKMSVPEFRDKCREFASNFVDLQRTSFRRLGVMGEWEKPYLTMDPAFEAREMRVFGEMFKKGYIYKGLKPVYWCPNDETALAEAEIEYSDDPCTSVYVKFAVSDDKGLLGGVCDLKKTYFIIWTTTTWTLPGNLAIALHPDEEYSVTRADNGEFYITVSALTAKTMAAGGIKNYETVLTLPGRKFEFMRARHPFLDRESVVVCADYVTTESGTGCVHTAPGFGADDYVTCRRYGIDIIVPVDDRGFQTEEAGKFAGLHYTKSNDAIFEDMKESGALFAFENVTHSYPHCWRCKKPIIFRATPQWFCSVKDFRDDALRAAAEVEWIPAWGGERIAQMIRERADWCISRQRHWGLPIPVFYCEDCGKPVCTDETIDAVSKLFAKSGSNAWYEKDAADILPDGFVCPHCGGRHFTKETDTLDGWFDSGSTHFAVCEGRDELSWPADLYLEGADQYRGWFQSSLLTAVGAKNQGAPYRRVLTHGWVVDGEGKAMHKSLGNSIAPEEMIAKYGADLVRLWVASSDYTVDVRASEAIFKQLSESYRKIRNTARIILANLGDVKIDESGKRTPSDFNPDTDCLPLSELAAIDKWALYRLNLLVERVRRAYDSYQFHIIYHEIHNFCSVDMSKLYIDITKDRVYVEAKASRARRSAQTAMYIIIDSLAKLLAPILSFTADEIWHSLPHSAEADCESVFLADMPAFRSELDFSDVGADYDKLFELRDDVMKALELARAEKKIGKSLDAKVTVYASGKDYETLREFESELSTIFIVSQAKLASGEAPAGAFTETEHIAGALVESADGEKCDRCWVYSSDCKEDGGSKLCKRCRSILNK